MSQQELLTETVRRLEALGIAYMLTGSFASSLQGEPRTTHDIDIVLQINAAAVDRLTSAFPAPRFYLDAETIREAIATGQMFNVVDSESGDKVDFWVLTEEPFDRSRFERRIVEDFEGIAVRVSSPEDTILMKLKWAAAYGESVKQTTDALRVYEVQHRGLDQAYLDHWAGVLGVAPALAQLRRAARPVS